MADLQRVVILCVAVAVILAGVWWFMNKPPAATSQINPPSLELDTVPENGSAVKASDTSASLEAEEATAPTDFSDVELFATTSISVELPKPGSIQ